MDPRWSFTSALHGTEADLVPPGSFTDAYIGGGEANTSRDEHAQATSRSRSTPKSSASTKKRKTTYDIRREQKVELTTQVETLQKQLDEIKYRVLVEQGEAARSDDRAAVGNLVLQEFIQEQHLELANLQAMLAGNLQQNVASLQPAQSIIRLGKDPIERHNTLVVLKDQKLREAKRFITARSQGLDPQASYFQEERNNSPGEDFCLVIFENRVVHGASARMVFDAFIDVAQSAEIVISEMFGSVTIREDDASDTRDISQMRLVTSTTQGTLVESNSVMFTEFVEAKDATEESYGLIVADYVDSDELYPYKPEERARRDTTTVFMIRSFMQPVVSDSKSVGKATATDDKELVVVASRWSCSKIRRSALSLSADALQELQESTVSFGGTMKKCIQQRLGKLNTRSEAIN